MFAVESINNAQRNIENEIIKFLDVVRSNVLYKLDEKIKRIKKRNSNEINLLYKVDNQGSQLDVYFLDVDNKTKAVGQLTVNPDGSYSYRFHTRNRVDILYAIQEYAEDLQTRGVY